MRSVRDITNKLPESRSGLENYVLKYSPEVREAIDSDPSKKMVLERLIDDSFDKYSKHIGGFVHGVSSLGHGVGYTADAWLLGTGDIVGSLGGNFIDLLAQVPEKSYSLVYAAQTGNYLDSLQNIFEGLVSYLPGFTVADQGLSRIVQKRMIHDVVKNARREFGLRSSWHKKLYHENKGSYTDVKNRSGNVISPKDSESKLSQSA